MLIAHHCSSHKLRVQSKYSWWLSERTFNRNILQDHAIYAKFVDMHFFSNYNDQLNWISGNATYFESDSVQRHIVAWQSWSYDWMEFNGADSDEQFCG
jgi:hypothetical protein